MESSVHIRSNDCRTMAICGSGAPWSSSIAFEKEDQPATCRYCITIRDKAAKDG